MVVVVAVVVAVAAVVLGGVVSGNLDARASIEEFRVVPPFHDEHVRDRTGGLRTPRVVAAGGPTGGIFA